MAAKKSDISIGGQNKYPKKTSVNLCIVESHLKQNIISLLVFAAFMCVVLVFVRIFVMGQYAEVDKMEQEYNSRQQELTDLKTSNSNYEEVRAEYSHYGNGYLNDEETIEQDRLEILKVVEDKLLPAGALENISIDGNTATLTINNKKLANVSDIVASLEENDIVEYATVTNSATEDQTNQMTQDGTETESAQNLSVTSTMTIVFKNAVTATTNDGAATDAAATDSAAASTQGGE